VLVLLLLWHPSELSADLDPDDIGHPLNCALKV